MSGRKKFSLVLGLLAALAMQSGCGGDAKSSNAPVPAMRTVTDDLGRKVTVPVHITRAVSLAPNLTENIFAVGAGDRLVGVTTFCNYPEQAKALPKIGDTMNPNMETIVGLKPDVVFVSTASQIETFTKTLDANGIAVFVTNPNSLDAVLKSLLQFGELFETVSNADVLVRDLRLRLNTISETAAGKPRVRVFVQISREPLFTIGKGSFLTDMLTTAGAESVTANVETAYPKLSKETAIALDPELIVLSASDDNREPNEVFKNSKAVTRGRVVSINADLLSRPGPRLVDALEMLAGELQRGMETQSR